MLRNGCSGINLSRRYNIGNGLHFIYQHNIAILFHIMFQISVLDVNFTATTHHSATNIVLPTVNVVASHWALFISAPFKAEYMPPFYVLGQSFLIKFTILYFNEVFSLTTNLMKRFQNKIVRRIFLGANITFTVWPQSPYSFHPLTVTSSCVIAIDLDTINNLKRINRSPTNSSTETKLFIF